MPARAIDPDAQVAALTEFVTSLNAGEYAAYATQFDAVDRAILDDLRERGTARILQEGWRTDPLTMARHLEGDGYADWRFVRYLAGKFRDAVYGKDPNQIWSLPQQVGKSALVRRGIAWALDADPSLPIILISYADALALESARWVRDYGIEHADQLRYRLRADAKAAGRWLTTEGGGLLATGAGGSVSGFPAGGLVIDDPHKGWAEAHSPVEQGRLWDEYQTVWSPRLREGGWKIIIHTRWTKRDLSGLVLDDAAQTGERWTHVRLPMIATENNDPIGRNIGDPLEPERYSLDACRARATAMGSYKAAAVEQQDPQPLEGGQIKRHWWKITAAGSMPEKCDEWLTSWDMKLKDRADTGDFVVGQVWGRTGSSFWCYDQFRGQWDQATVKAAIALCQVRWPQVKRHIIENTGNGPEVMEQLVAGHRDWVMSDEMAGNLGVTGPERAQVELVMRRGMPGLIPNNPKGNKMIRTIAVSPLIEAGNVHLRDAPFAEDLIGEHAAFPTRGVPDDMVDATSQALAILSGTPGTTSVATAATTALPTRRPGTSVPGRVGQLPRRSRPGPR